MIAVRAALQFSVFLACVLASSVLLHEPAQAQLSREPMIFFVAEGGPGACGPGCSKWIAADGFFDKDAGRRLSDFLATLKGRNLPIFFNSPGGSINAARVVSRVMRARRMTASIGVTAPEVCGGKVAAEKSCRKTVQPRDGSKAHLRTRGAQCFSACVYALIGASDRKVPSGALLGVHAAKLTTESAALLSSGKVPTKEQRVAALKVHVLEMGVDAALVDAAEKTPNSGIHILSRKEIARYGLETTKVYETGWMLYTDRSPKMGNSILKAVTYANGEDGKEFVTAVMRLRCHSISPVLMMEYQRELATNEVGNTTGVVHIAAGGKISSTLSFTTIQDATDLHFGYVNRDFVHEALAAGSILVAEKFAPKVAPSWTRELKFSAAGLERALKTPLKNCPGL